jgi:hypothetical protein
VLVTGEASAEVESIQAALRQVELEVRSQYNSNHIAMEVTVCTLAPSEVSGTPSYHTPPTPRTTHTIHPYTTH